MSTDYLSLEEIFQSGTKSMVLAIHLLLTIYTCSLLVQHSNGVYTVGDFMTRRDNLHVVQPTTPVDQGTYPYSMTHVFTCFAFSQVANFSCFFACAQPWSCWCSTRSLAYLWLTMMGSWLVYCKSFLQLSCILLVLTLL